MTDSGSAFQVPHSHVFLGRDHDRAERRTWAVIALCTVMMIAEIIGGALFGSLALIADGLHMSTHAGALLLAALAYTFARKYATDPNFTFGTGKFGDLAGYSSAIVLAMIALLIGYEAVLRFLDPVPIAFNEAISIASLGLLVNIASAFLLAGGHHDHGHSHSHGPAHSHEHEHGEKPLPIALGSASLAIEIFEDNVPPRFRITPEHGVLPAASDLTLETVRPDGGRQHFSFVAGDGYLESREEIPEPHAFVATIRLVQAGQTETLELPFEEHDHTHGSHHRDNNMRAAVVHVMADAAVSILVIVGLLLARTFGWLWMDPLAGLIGAFVIASWSLGLLRDTGAVLLDRTPDPHMAKKVKTAIESEGDHVTDLHVWRLGPGHLGTIVSIVTSEPREPAHYRKRLARFTDLSHVTVEVHHMGSVNR